MVQITENPSPSPVTAPDTQTVFKEWDKVQVYNPASWLHGKFGEIRSFPNDESAIVSFVVSGNQHVRLTELKLFERAAHADSCAQETDVNLASAVATVVDNLHLLTSEELKALEDAIAIVKRSWDNQAA